MKLSLKSYLRTFQELILFQIRDFLREPETIFWAFFFPILTASLLGIAFSPQRKRSYQLGILGEAPQKHLIKEEAILSFREYPSLEEAKKALLKGEILLIIAPKEKKVYLDPSYDQALLAWKIFLEEKTSSSWKMIPLYKTRYIDFLIPGLIGMMIMNSCLWGLGYSLIEARIKKILKHMILTPLAKWLLLLSYGVGRFFLVSIEVLALYVSSSIIFDFTLQGEEIDFFLVYLAGFFAFWGMAILVASRTSSLRSANNLINFITLPMLLLSGVFFSYHFFPEELLPYIKHLPLTLLNDALRGVLNEGKGAKDFLYEISLLVFMGITSFFLGIRYFKWYS